MTWWEDPKLQMLLNTYFPRRAWLVAEGSREFVSDNRKKAGLS